MSDIDAHSALQEQVAGFASPTTRMLLAGNGLTAPVLEAALGAALRVRVLRQDSVPAEQIPEAIARELRLTHRDRVVVRRSCLLDAQLTLVSVNIVIAAIGEPTAAGIARLDVPIGYSLIAPGISQHRRILRAGMGRWPDGRECAAKGYVVDLDERPWCYIRECFNPSLISAELSRAAGHRDTLGRPWDDEPATVPPVDCGHSPALQLTERPALHQPVWRDDDAARQCVERLRGLPALTSAAECDRLTEDLAAAATGDAFVLQLGDCAETFDSCNTRSLVSRQALAAAAAAVFAYGSGRSVVTIGRIAGQYAKPRSAPIEASTGVTAYFGDMLNCAEPDPAARLPDPHRMLRAYFHAAATLNHVRTHPAPPSAALSALLRRAAGVCPAGDVAALLGDVANMFDLATAAPPDSRVLHSVIPELRISHEALVLAYEHALTRRAPDRRWWDSSAHLLWIGERTRQADHAHIEFARAIANPVAVKLGPTTRPEEVSELCQLLNPEQVAGRLTLIPRLGVRRTEALLPQLLNAAAATGTPVCWVADPMHANTRPAGNGRKTRHYDDIIAEIEAFFGACRQTGTIPGGLHLETTPDDVTECLGGWQQLGDDDLARDYRTHCDPRLNAIQTIGCIAVAVKELARQPSLAAAKHVAPQYPVQRSAAGPACS